MSVHSSRARALAVSVAGLTAVGLALQAPVAMAAPAAPGSLDVEQPNATTSILSWSRVSGARRYEVQVDSDPGFPTPNFTASTVNDAVVPTVNLPGGSTYWRVRSVDSAGSTSTWSSGSFASPPGSVPVPLSPNEGDSLQQPHEPPVLVWDGTASATSYTVEVDGDSDFVGASSWTTKATSFVVPDPLGAGDWFWRVTASRGGGLSSTPSATASFEISPLPKPVLTSPTNSANEPVEDVTLDWLPVNGAKSYEVEVANNQDFTTIIDRRTGILGSRYSPPKGYNNDQYYWRVRAIDLGGVPTPWSESPFNFKRQWPDRPWPVFPVQEGFPSTPDDENHDPTALPPRQVTTAAPYLQWTPVQHASHYVLEIDTQANFSSPSLQTCKVAGTTYTPGNGVFRSTSMTSSAEEDCDFQEGTLLYWRVRPKDRPFTASGFADGIEGIYSPTQSFVWDPEYFADLSPTSGQLVDVPTFRWTPVGPAEKFRVEIFKDGASSPFHSATTYSTSYTPVNVALASVDGPFRWRLSAVDARGQSSALVTNTFQVSGALPNSGTAPLTLLSGTAGEPAILRAPSLSWEPMAGAHHYRVSMGDHGTGFNWIPVTGESLGRDLFYPAVTETGKRVLTPGQYDWYVEAFDASGSHIGTSSTGTFRIAGFPKVTGQRIALDGLTLDNAGGCSARLVTGAKCEGVPATPVLSWNHQPGMSFYAVYVSQDANFTNLTETTRIPATSNSRYAFTFSNQKPALPDNQSGIPFYWHIRACKAVGVCGPDPVSAATSLAENAFVKTSPRVELQQPVDAASPVSTNEVTFDWEDYFVTNQGTTWSGETSPQAAQSYRIQVDDNDSFSAPFVDDATVDQSTYTAVTKLYPEGTLWWRVAAIDGAGNELNWSIHRSFTKSSPTVSRMSPSGEVRVPGTTPFTWQAAPFASEYRLEVYKNDDTTFSSANLVFSKSALRTAAYAHTTPLPASSQPYVWRVRRDDASHNPGRWSATGRFYSTGIAPTRVSPTGGAQVPTDRGLFEWTLAPDASQDATDYLVEIREEGSSYSRFRQETVATAWAPTSAIPDGTWEWRVTARDANRGSLGTSGWGSFTVDGSGPTVTRYSPSSRARARANVTASFSEPVARATVNGRTFLLKKVGTRRKVLARVTISSDGLRAVLNPSLRLRRGAYYTATLKAAITDRQGNPLTAKTWRFVVR